MTDIDMAPIHPYVCSGCESRVQLGKIEGEMGIGLYCDCTKEAGRPYKTVSGHPFPSKWCNIEEMNWELEDQQ